MSEFNYYNKIARIISTLFVPPSFTLILFTFIAFYLEDNLLTKSILLIVTVTFGFLFHILLFFYLIKKGKIADYDATIKEERTFPFVISIGIYLIGFIILIIFQINPVSLSFWFCYISNTLIVIFINKYWKISIHAMGAAGPLAVIFLLAGNTMFIFLPIVFLVGWSRVYLKCHTITQVLAGSIFGFLSSYIQIQLILKYIYV